MTPRNAIAIEIGPRHLRALHATRDRERLRVHRAIVRAMPQGLDVANPEAVGAWIRGELDAAGFPRGRVTLALAREHVGLKRLSLPSVDPDELPGMTRLALQRELPFDADRAVIDYVPVVQDASSTEVTAVAVPEPVLARARATMAAAGREIERIGLRLSGSTALRNSLGDDELGPVLAIDITGDSVEFCVLAGGAILFSRAAPLAEPDADAADVPAVIAESVITETRRTWMSYRIADDSRDVERVVLMGDRDVTERAAGPIGEILAVATTIVEHHPLVEPGGERLDGVWPLAGILLEPALGGDTIDFAHPRRPVDRVAQARKYGLMVAGLLVVIVLGIWTTGRRTVTNLESRLSVASERSRELRPLAQRYQRDTFLLAHLNRWTSADVRWLDHVHSLHRIAPPPSEVVLDSWVGTLDFRGVRYAGKTKAWSSPASLAIVVDGEARDRATADAFRAALVETEWYTTKSAGADARGGKRLPYGFTYRLMTDRPAPPSDETTRVDDTIATAEQEGAP